MTNGLGKKNTQKVKRKKKNRKLLSTSYLWKKEKRTLLLETWGNEVPARYPTRKARERLTQERERTRRESRD